MQETAIKEELQEEVKLKPNPNCKQCFGRGYVRTIDPHLNASIYRVLRPCSCVKAVIKI